MTKMETWRAVIQNAGSKMWFTNISAVVLSAATVKSAWPQQEQARMLHSTRTAPVAFLCSEGFLSRNPP